jgi:hypothetical protein
LDARDFPLVNENGVDDAILQASFTRCLERDRTVVEDAGDFTLGQGKVGPFDQDGRKARILSVGKDSANRES